MNLQIAVVSNVANTFLQSNCEGVRSECGPETNRAELWHISVLFAQQKCTNKYSVEL